MPLPGRPQDADGFAADEIARVLAGHPDEMLDGLGAAELAQGADGFEPDVVGIVPERGQDLGDDGRLSDLAQDLQGAAAAPGGTADLEQGLGGGFLDVGQSLFDELLEEGDGPMVLQPADRLDGPQLELGTCPGRRRPFSRPRCRRC